MKTVELSDPNAPSLPEILALADHEPLILRTSSGDEYILGVVDDFQREIERYDASSALQALLRERGEEKGVVPIEEIQARIK
jgi:hypothetical protein